MESSPTNIVFFTYQANDLHKSRSSKIMYQHRTVRSSSSAPVSFLPQHESLDPNGSTIWQKRFEQQEQRQYQQQIQHNPYDDDSTSAGSLSSSGDLWQPSPDIHPSCYNSFDTDWSYPQVAEQYTAVLPAYGLPMTSAEVPMGGLWSNTLLVTTSGSVPNIFALPHSLTMASEWMHNDPPSTVSEAAPTLLRTSSSPTCASPDGHAHNNPGAGHSPEVKMEPYDVSVPDYFPVAYRAPCFRAYDRSEVPRTAIPVPIKEEDIFVSTMSQEPSLEQTSPTLSRKRKSVEVEDESSDDAGRSKRNYTTEANAKCRCDVCGKLFKRSFNLRAHREVHNPHRETPFPCVVPGCIKRFVRKTDLTRHHLSVSTSQDLPASGGKMLNLSQVHVKEKNFHCHMCGAQFARKDTCRR